MKWADISDGVWTIATAEREKGNAGALALPAQALAIIEAQPRIGDNPYVSPVAATAVSTCRKASRRSTPSCRRCRAGRCTICAHRAQFPEPRGVRPDIAERVLGHSIGGVEGVYDRHRYDAEKAAALAKLAALIEGIVNPRDNVAPEWAKRDEAGEVKKKCSYNDPEHSQRQTGKPG